MISEVIQSFRKKLQQDEENKILRRKFHENYEWLESYWQQKFNGNNGEQKFCNVHQDFYWSIDELKSISKKLATLEPVKNSRNSYIPSENIIRATYYLKYNSDLFNDNELSVIEKELNSARRWNGTPFKAAFEIVIQIRNNLFHGRKIDLELEQYDRNKNLIKIAVEFTDLLLANLVEAEKESFLSYTN